jgi:hypothetical protein
LVVGLLVGEAEVGVYKRTKETFGVVSGACQLFDNVRLAAGLAAAAEYGVRTHVGDMNAMWSSVSALEEASSGAGGIVEVFGNVG